MNFCGIFYAFKFLVIGTSFMLFFTNKLLSLLKPLVCVVTSDAKYALRLFFETTSGRKFSLPYHQVNNFSVSI
jgi:hypothetical protein